MKLQKYSRVDHQYHNYYVPDSMNIPLYTTNLDEIINCCQCMKEMRFKDGYTSLEVHNDYGLGYSVCPECYQEEWKRRYEDENTRKEV